MNRINTKLIDDIIQYMSSSTQQKSRVINKAIEWNQKMKDFNFVRKYDDPDGVAEFNNLSSSLEEEITTKYRHFNKRLMDTSSGVLSNLQQYINIAAFDVFLRYTHDINGDSLIYSIFDAITEFKPNDEEYSELHDKCIELFKTEMRTHVLFKIYDELTRVYFTSCILRILAISEIWSSSIQNNEDLYGLYAKELRELGSATLEIKKAITDPYTGTRTMYNNLFLDSVHEFEKIFISYIVDLRDKNEKESGEGNTLSKAEQNDETMYLINNGKDEDVAKIINAKVIPPFTINGNNNCTKEREVTDLQHLSEHDDVASGYDYDGDTHKLDLRQDNKENINKGGFFMFDNVFDGAFGKAEGVCLAITGDPAVKCKDGKYKTYNLKKDRLTNISKYVFPGTENMFFIVPALKVKAGDLIYVADQLAFVVEVDSRGNRVKIVNFENNRIEEILPERHIFMEKVYFYRRVVSPIGNMMKKNRAAIMKMAMMSQMFGTSGNTNAPGNPFTSMFGDSGNNPLMSMIMFQSMGGSNIFESMFDGIIDESEEKEAFDLSDITEDFVDIDNDDEETIG